jgi:general secretion pathway protein C
LVAADLEASVRNVSDTEWEVVRSYRDQFLADPSVPMSAARVIPEEVDGERVGVRLFGIRRSSLLGAIGFQNGDTVRTLNGRSLAEPDAALEAYAALRSVDRYEIELERRGVARTHVVRVVDAFGETASE